MFCLRFSKIKHMRRRTKTKNNKSVILLLILFSFVVIILSVASIRLYRQLILLRQHNQELEQMMEMPDLPEVNIEKIMRDQLLLQREGEEIIVIMRDDEEEIEEAEEGWLQNFLNKFR
jgi:hypothetical protein